MTDCAPRSVPRPGGRSPVLLALVAMLWSGSAVAQAPRPERPFRGLFGGGVGNTEQSLTAHASLGGSYDDNLLAEARGNYKIVARLFNMEQRDYKRFLNFLRKHDCQVPFKEYR